MLINYVNVDIYQAEKRVLAGVNFTAGEGDFIYIIGKVGSGKSSLLKTMYAELDIYSDECERAEVLGRNMLRLKRRAVPALRRETGIIFQDFQLLPDRSVRRNLAFVLRATGKKKKAEIEERIGEVLAKTGLEDKIDAMPYELSGGEQQRVAIARALLNNPKIIIADEPTGNLDPDTAVHIVALLKDISATGTAVVMSTHNWTMIDRYPGRVYKCEDGRLIELTEQEEDVPSDKPEEGETATPETAGSQPEHDEENNENKEHTTQEEK
ncbi:MAG: ATP-binding cassette domain-containing protein [Prevotella sp.]|nr:ATP-binding cassette domain-containing protein [Prevotella sp.]